ncbi:hypothetical protein DYI25_04405 [Mesobacillus boroniphilus]|uniref:Uncharacterized protein n=1 Tax=Mesobacillus boroniphilus TaxID=308892 RepID=A0A944CIL2_9BACI|nr:hypothetical protein [Mesobacillus boroniphilus]MBS8263683.1 hypothetical protein [Mesobacillus boroniphilus]
MFWVPYLALLINLLIIWFMPKRLTNREIYTSWAVIALINLSTDILLDLYFNLYELGGPGVQIRVHFIEITLGASFGIIFLNFMPRKISAFVFYMAGWLVISILFELLMVKVGFIHYTGWKIWYSVPYYIAAFSFVRWHLYFIRKDF